MTDPTPVLPVAGGVDLSTFTTPRTAAARDMPAMLAAVTAQRLQLEQLVQSGADVSAQLAGLLLVEAHLPGLVQYATQLEGIAAGLSILKGPPDMTAPLGALAAALERLAAALPPPVPPRELSECAQPATG